MAENLEVNEDINVLQQLEQFFQDIDNLLSMCDQERNTISRPLIERIIIKLELSIEVILQIIPLLIESRSVVNEIGTNFQIIRRDWCRKIQELELRRPPNCTHLAVYSLYPPQVTASEGPGRPKYDISEEVLLNLRALGYSWKEISSLLLVSRTTLWRRVAELGIREETGFSNISDEQLDQFVKAFIDTHGFHVGFSMVYGHLRSTRLKVQRDRVRASLRRVDPENSGLRWATVITRRTYSVPGPNSLWHIDGHHSLINWGL